MWVLQLFPSPLFLHSDVGMSLRWNVWVWSFFHSTHILGVTKTPFTIENYLSWRIFLNTEFLYFDPLWVIMVIGTPYLSLTKFILDQRNLYVWKWGPCALRHWIQKFNGSHFGLPPSSIQKMTAWVAISRILWRMRTAHIMHYWVLLLSRNDCIIMCVCLHFWKRKRSNFNLQAF